MKDSRGSGVEEAGPEGKPRPDPQAQAEEVQEWKCRR